VMQGGKSLVPAQVGGSSSAKMTTIVSAETPVTCTRLSMIGRGGPFLALSQSKLLDSNMLLWPEWRS
jgi:hypothetical protein